LEIEIEELAKNIQREEFIGPLVDNLSADKVAITIKELLTMSSGFTWNELDNSFPHLYKINVWQKKQVFFIIKLYIFSFVKQKGKNMFIDSQKKAELTKKQEMFCRHYAQNGHNRTVAAISAGYSIKSAKDAAYKNFKKPHIVEFLNELEKPVMDKLGLDENWVLTKLKNFSDVNITDFFDFDPQANKIQLKDLREMPVEKTAAIKSLKETKYGINIKLVDKRACVVNIGKHLGMFKEQAEDNFNYNNLPMVFVVPAIDIDEDDERANTDFPD